MQTKPLWLQKSRQKRVRNENFSLVYNKNYRNCVVFSSFVYVRVSSRRWIVYFFEDTLQFEECLWMFISMYFFTVSSPIRECDLGLTWQRTVLPCPSSPESAILKNRESLFYTQKTPIMSQRIVLYVYIRNWRTTSLNRSSLATSSRATSSLTFSEVFIYASRSETPRVHDTRKTIDNPASRRDPVPMSRVNQHPERWPWQFLFHNLLKLYILAIFVLVESTFHCNLVYLNVSNKSRIISGRKSRLGQGKWHENRR
jgi:hypothetical protein